MPEAQQTVTLVIPGRNAASTLDECLAAAEVIRAAGLLREIIFVDDGSTDATPYIARQHRVLYVRAAGSGPAQSAIWVSARQIPAWSGLSTAIVLPIPRPCRTCWTTSTPPTATTSCAGDGRLGAVGGTYTNCLPNSGLATLIQAEIAERHRRMPREVDYLGSFNVLYRRAALEQVGGFDESQRTARTPSWPIACSTLVGDWSSSRVRASATTIRRGCSVTCGTQRIHGYYRVRVYLRHPGFAAGDSYSSAVDHLQPPLAMLVLCCRASGADGVVVERMVLGGAGGLGAGAGPAPNSACLACGPRPRAAPLHSNGGRRLCPFVLARVGG